jgi:ribosomal 50S subunit-associated protein YjgA (DUF615 family)
MARHAGQFTSETGRAAGRLGAHVTHSRHDSQQITRKAREAFLARFEREVDPDGILPIEERRKRAEHAKRAYFSRIRRMRGSKPNGGGDA